MNCLCLPWVALLRNNLYQTRHLFTQELAFLGFQLLTSSAQTITYHMLKVLIDGD